MIEKKLIPESKQFHELTHGKKGSVKVTICRFFGGSYVQDHSFPGVSSPAHNPLRFLNFFFCRIKQIRYTVLISEL